MIDGDLAAFARRTRATLDREGNLSGANTDLRVVLPLLKTLGWAVHGTEVVADHEVDAPGDDADGVTVDYALALDHRPAVFVVTAGTGVELSSEHADRLRTAMTAAGVDHGLVTNGRTYVFVAADGAELREVRCSLAELPEQTSLCALYTRRAARARQRRSREAERTRVADTLRERRETTVEAFLDRTIDALDAGDHPGESRRPATADDRDATTDGAESSTTTEDEETASSGATAASDGGATREADPRDEGAPMSRNAGGDEYVVRFFDDRSSVGAVGTDTSGGAVAQAAGYLLEHHALGERLDLPWSPADGDAVPASAAVVSREPRHPDGSRMSAPREVADGYHVETALDTPVAREAVEALAERSGLRVMLQGAW